MSVEVLQRDRGPITLLIASTTCGANLIARIIFKRLRLGEADAATQRNTRECLSHRGFRIRNIIGWRPHQIVCLFNDGLPHSRHHALSASLHPRSVRAGGCSTRHPWMPQIPLSPPGKTQGKQYRQSASGQPRRWRRPAISVRPATTLATISPIVQISIEALLMSIPVHSPRSNPAGGPKRLPAWAAGGSAPTAKPRRISDILADLASGRQSDRLALKFTGWSLDVQIGIG